MKRVVTLIRILQCVNDMHRAGLETMLMNYYRNIDRTKIQFDFLTHRPYRSDYDDEIESLGGKIYYAPRLYPNNYPKYFKWMSDFFKEHPEYKIVHSHIDAMSYLPLYAAKKAGVPIRIAHSHSTAIDKDYKYFLKQFFRFRINTVCNLRLSCGQEAGNFLFRNKNFDVIPNAVDAQKFYYNEEIRNTKRTELNITNELVIGHIGRFSYPKNHKFLIKVFNELLKIKPNSMLLLVGTGEKEKEIKKQIKSLGIESKVKFLGNRNDTNEIYQAMDVFVMPSLFEGIPLVGIEAQFADLPCVFSNKIPQEVKFNDKSVFIPLGNPQEWTCQITRFSKLKRDCPSQYSSVYNISNSIKVLEEVYINANKGMEL